MYSYAYSLFPALSTLLLSPFLLLILIWSVAIKGYALWHAARDNRPGWFVALLVINTFGLLELLYLFVIRASKNQVSLPPAPHEEPKH